MAAVLLLVAVPATLAIVAVLDAWFGSRAANPLAVVPPKYLIAGTVMAVGAVCAVVAAGSVERGLFLLFVLSIPVRAVLRFGDMPADINILLGQWTPSGNPAWMGYPLGQLSVALSDLPLALLWLRALPGLGRRLSVVDWWIWTGAALFVTAEVLSIWAASHATLAWWAVFETVKAIAGAAYVVYRTRSRGDFIYALNALSLAVVLQAGLALAQFLTGGTLGLTFSGIGTLATLEGGRSVRSSGTFAHAQMLAMYVGMFLPLLVAVALPPQPLRGRIGRALCVLAGSVALMLTFSRMAWLACGVGAVLVVLATSLNRKHAGQIVRASVVLLLVLAGTVPLWSTLASSFTLERSGSGFDVIAELYRVAFNMIAAHPLDGVGINNFSFVMSQYDRTGIAMFIAAPVHNVFVLTLAEMGPLGLMGLIAVITVPAARLWRARRYLDHEGRCIVAGLLGGLLVFVLLGVTGWTYYIIQAPVWFFVGMALAASRLPRFTDSSATRAYSEMQRS